MGQYGPPNLALAGLLVSTSQSLQTGFAAGQHNKLCTVFCLQCFDTVG